MADPMDIANELYDKAVMAAAVFSQMDQEQVDRIVEAVYRAGFANRVRLAKMAHEETGMGIWQHKVIKNVAATQLVYEDIKDQKTVGVLSSNERTGITEIAQPLGPIFAVTPVTNPTSTVMYKILIALKSRNPIIISPAKRAVKCCIEAANICYQAAIKANAPLDCIQCLDEVSREVTKACMTHPKVALILATGGTGLVHAAYSSGTPAIGVGPGNVPVLIDTSADIPFAIDSIIRSKTFDNGMICASEQAVVVEEKIAQAVRAEFEKQQCYFLKGDEIKKVQAVAVDPESGMMSPAIVGQSVANIAKMAGINPPEGTKILLAQLDGVGREYPLSGEVLTPILAFYVRPDYQAAVKTCIELNYLGGIGHTASIYANDRQRVLEFSEHMNAGRVLVNTPSSQGAVGYFFNSLNMAFTLGCGSGGKNSTTENITATNLINIKRVCRRRENARWMQFDREKFFDENLSADDILKEYNHNY